MGAVRRHMFFLTPRIAPALLHAKDMAHDGNAPLAVGPQEGTYSVHLGGNGCSTGPYVLSNPTHHPYPSRAKDTAHDVSVPQVVGPKEGTYAIYLGGGGCSTGPYVGSNTMHHPYPPRAQDTAHDGSAPFVAGPQEGTYSIHFRRKIGAVRAHMFPLTPCITPTHQVPRTRHTKGACPLSLHHATHNYALASLSLPLPLRLPPRPLLGGRTAWDMGLGS